MTTILVVDDSAMDRKIAGGLLQKRSGWGVVYADDGLQALEQIEMHVPDIVVTDLQMPGMDGLQLVARVRQDYPLLPIVLMTAQGSEETAVRALQQGAANYVPKRILADELVDTVARVLSASSVDRTHSRLLHRLKRNVSQFEIENDLSLIPSLVHYLQQVLTRMRVCSETEVLRSGVALEEALLNAYYHGNLEISSELRLQDHNAYYDLARERVTQEPYSNRRIYVSAEMTPTEATYVVRDEGPGFDPREIPDATDPANIEKPCGRGLLLIHTFMDEVHYNEPGNEVAMIKRHRVE
jgi:CheY-like chemotaxis protein